MDGYNELWDSCIHIDLTNLGKKETEEEKTKRKDWMEGLWKVLDDDFCNWMTVAFWLADDTAENKVKAIMATYCHSHDDCCTDGKMNAD